jgi:hypothetical protein
VSADRFLRNHVSVLPGRTALKQTSRPRQIAMM